MDEDIVREYVTEGLVKEYGEDNGIEVEVTKNGDDSEEEQPSSSLRDDLFDSDFVFMVGLVMVCVLLIICCVLSILLIRKSKRRKPAIYHEQILSPMTSTSATESPGETKMEMQPIGPGQDVQTPDGPGTAATSGATNNYIIAGMGGTPGDVASIHPVPSNSQRPSHHAAVDSIGDTAELPEAPMDTPRTPQTPDMEDMYDDDGGNDHGSDSDDDDVFYGKGTVKMTKGGTIGRTPNGTPDFNRNESTQF